MVLCGATIFSQTEESSGQVIAGYTGTFELMEVFRMLFNWEVKEARTCVGAIGVANRGSP